MTPPEEPSPPPPGWEESDGEDSSDELEQEYFRLVYAGYQKKKDAAELGGQMHDMLAKHVCKLHAVAAMLEGRGKPGQRVLLSRPFRADMLQLRHDSQLQHRRDKLTPKQ
eukprot:TRINITY_DN1249_c0_g1_i1.p1 TRINITY_DN1249_c0_g1~~TRINITY_DN1249_c0_g1_i1.p1  ORF type:complete len:110 (-),score=24.64 TRINITY_DN1249_c0_g1_i1:153-482(-)